MDDPPANFGLQPSLPDDLRNALAQGLNTTLEHNFLTFVGELKEPRDGRKDWLDGFRHFNARKMTEFELSVRLGRLLDELSAVALAVNDPEEPELTHDDMDPVIVAVLNAEYTMLKLNYKTPLRQLPFLLQWVTAADGIRGVLQANRDKLGTQEFGLREVFLRSRLELIYCVLRGMVQFEGVETWPQKHIGTMTPMEVMEHAIKTHGEPAWLNLAPYATLLDEVGVTLPWDVAALIPDPLLQSPEKNLADLHTTEPSPSREKAPASAPSSRATATPTVADIQKYILVEPQRTIQILQRLPCDLPSLDLLTELASTTILDDVGADTVHILREYIQHCLRSIEKMNEDPSSSNDSNISADPSSDTDYEPVKGKDEQARAVGLVVMFVRNLLGKGYVPINDVMYEIQEICIRYIWVREVRDFRAWLEGSEEVEEPQRQVGGRMGG